METDEVTDKELSEMIADLMAYGSLAGSHEAVYGAHPVSRIAAAAGRILNPGRSSMPLDNPLAGVREDRRAACSLKAVACSSS